MKVDLLESLKIQHPLRINFNDPANAEDIKMLENYFGITLPNSYKKFLLNYDGGFICGEKLAEIILRDKSLETAEWNSLKIFSVTELIYYYDKYSTNNWKLDEDWEGVYPVIPFARTETQELLVFIADTGVDEYPIFDAFHEDPVSDWGKLFDSFEEFFERYVTEMGELKTISDADQPTAEKFLPDSGWRERPEYSEDPNEIVDYCTASIKIAGPTAYAHKMRAIAYIKLGKLDLAEKDINEAITIEPDDSYAFNIYAGICEEQGRFEDALKFHDISVSLEDDSDSSAICLRANFHLSRGNYNEAINDATKAIEIDPNDDYPYMIRFQAYKNLGMDKEAAADGDIIDELMSN